MQKEEVKDSEFKFLGYGMSDIYNNPGYFMSGLLLSYGAYSVGDTLLSSYFYAHRVY